MSWLCLTFQLVGGGLAFGRMLCIASDGHVALEVAHAGACETEDRRHHDDAAEHASEAGIGCAEHPCTDVTLSNEALSGLLRSSHDGAPAHVSLIALLPPADRVDPLLGPSSPSTSPPESAVARRRTTVLLV